MSDDLRYGDLVEYDWGRSPVARDEEGSYPDMVMYVGPCSHRGSAPGLIDIFCLNNDEWPYAIVIDCKAASMWHKVKTT